MDSTSSGGRFWFTGMVGRWECNAPGGSFCSFCDEDCFSSLRWEVIPLQLNESDCWTPWEDIRVWLWKRFKASMPKAFFFWAFAWTFLLATVSRGRLRERFLSFFSFFLRFWFSCFSLSYRKWVIAKYLIQYLLNLRTGKSLYSIQRKSICSSRIHNTRWHTAQHYANRSLLVCKLVL